MIVRMSKSLKYIRCGKLYNGIDDEFKVDYSILVEGKNIVKVGPRFDIPESAEQIDLSDATVTPGLIDAHTHIENFDWRTGRDEMYKLSSEMRTIAAVRNAGKYLARGFTTIRHAGGHQGYGVLNVRDAIAQGYIEGSRIVAAAQFMCSPGSHGDFSQLYHRNPAISKHIQNDQVGLGSGKDFFVHAVREQAKYGADYIKIMATGGFASQNDSPVQQQLNDEELKAIMDTAHEIGIPVTAHVYTPRVMQKLVDFGITGLEHGSFMNQETAEKIASANVYLVPTFCPYEEAVHYDPEKIKLKNPEFTKKLELYRERLVEGREQIKKSKIRLGYGTDIAGVHQAYESGYEYMAWFKSGMGTFRTLKAATKTNAGILQIDHIVGTLEPGKLADISAWKRDLETDPAALLDCYFVMKGGVVFNTQRCEDYEGFEEM
jgi:imidazolonepropionase-like amidohydrolase